MGFLGIGHPLEYEDLKGAVADKVRSWGIEQLLALYKRTKDKESDAMLWGDEVEYLVVAMDQSGEKKVRLSLRQADILKALEQNEKHLLATVSEFGEGIAAPIFHPEFGRFMLEATPGKPWGIEFKDLLDVERDMRLRRKIAEAHTAENEHPITLTTFPRIGCKDTLTPEFPISGPKLRSQFVPDEIANPHIRFPTLAANIRARRGSKVVVNVPVYHDERTSRPWNDPTVNYDLHQWPEDDDVRNGAVQPDMVHMDAMAFGMGSCCLQITFQAKNVSEGRTMYDQLSPLGPILLALTAATPIYKGFLVDTDVRWNQISAAVDDRTEEERGLKPLKHNRWRIPKSRYASNSTYISLDPRLRPEYFDPDLVINPEMKQKLLDGGMDERLATHFAHLFIRDPIVVFTETLEELDLNETNHFENLQSTNWQHMRFKPPPPGSETGWRVEFRPMEIQPTDRENAAFSVFIVLLTRVILSFDLNLYIPIARVTENMETAHARNALHEKQFWFRRRVFSDRTRPNTPTSPGGVASSHGSSATFPLPPVEEEYALMTIKEIVNGPSDATSREGFPGLIPLVETYLAAVNIDVQTRCALEDYLDIVRRTADGRRKTPATWMREFVHDHREYKHDSVVSDTIQYDLVQKTLDLVREDEERARRRG